MSLTSNAWAPTLQIESLKFWFYALATGVILDMYELWFVYPSSASTSTSDEKDKQTKAASKPGKTRKHLDHSTNATATANTAKRRALYRALIVDGCDMFFAGWAVAWISADPVTAGVAGTVSALVSCSDIWIQLNA